MRTAHTRTLTLANTMDEKADALEGERRGRAISPHDGPGNEAEGRSSDAGRPGEGPTVPLRPAAPAGPTPSVRELRFQVPGYEVLREIGRGGMGVVFEARQVGLDRRVAIKMLTSGPLADAGALARFQAEAEAIARLRHPNIIQVHQIGTGPAGPYFVMELAGGGSLADYWEGKPLGPAQAASLVAVLARAIHHAHEAGIVHRDLKPGNVLLSGEHGEAPLTARVKITDFGLAKYLEGGRAPLTNPGQMLGTPGYMAPEQARGPAEAIGPATDIYALGVLLYEALTGGPPHRGFSAIETIRLTLSEGPLAPSRLRPGVPRDLETICLTCLHKEPARRYLSARALAEDLDRFQAGQPIQARPVGRLERAWKWARREPFLASSLVGIVLVTVLAFVLVTWQWQRAERLLRQEQLSSTKQQLITGSLYAEQGDYAPGLLHMARAHQGAPEGLRPSIEQLLGGWKRQVHPLLHAWQLPGRIEQVAATDKALVALCDGQAHRFDPDSGKPLGPRSGGRVVSLVPWKGGLAVVVQRGAHAIELRDMDSDRALLGPLAHDAEVVRAAVSVDERYLLSGTRDGQVHLWGLRDATRPLGSWSHAGGVRALAFSPDGRWAASAGNDPKVRLYHPDKGKEVGHLNFHHDKVGAIAFSPDSRLIASGGDDHQALVWDLADGALRHRLRHQNRVESLAFHRDGTLLATGCADDTARLWDMTSGLPAGAPLPHHHDVEALALAPDGEHLLTGSKDGLLRWWRLSRPNRPTAVLPHPGAVLGLGFSDRGELSTVCADREVRRWGPGLEALPSLLAPAPLLSLAVAANGDVVVGDREGRTYRFGADGKLNGPLTRQPREVLAVALRPDGSELLTGCEGPVTVARLWDARLGNPRRTFDRHTRKVVDVAFSPNQRWIATASWDYTARLWDATTGQPIGPPLEHQDLVQSVAFHPSGEKLATAGDDYTVRLWQLSPSGEAKLLDGLRHPEKLRAVTFVGGRIVAAGGRGGRIWLWEADTGRRLGPPLEHEGDVLRLAAHPDGTRLFSAGRRGGVRGWELPTPWAGTPDEVHRWLHIHTGARLDANGVLLRVGREEWLALARAEGLLR